MMMKRIISVILLLVLCAVLSSCAAKTSPQPVDADVWQDFSHSSFDWKEEPEFETTLDEFPDTVFLWKTHYIQSYTEILVQDSEGERTVVTGMPIINAYFADLNADGYRELCATVLSGSGAVDSHIAVYDHHRREFYYLWDRMEYDYSLYSENGKLYVEKSAYMNPDRKETMPFSLDGLTPSKTSWDIQREMQSDEK